MRWNPDAQAENLKPNKEKNMNFNRILGKTKYIVTILGMMDIFMLFALTYLANIIANFPVMMEMVNEGLNLSSYISLRYCFVYVGPHKLIIYFLFFVFLGLLDVKFYYKMKVSYSEDYFNIGQKGMARWTTKEEIKQQYKRIPECGANSKESFEGNPGTIVAHFGGNIYIDTAINNTLIVGITRSGKGEMYVYKTIDVYSRAEKKHSLIVCDPKLENYKSSYQTLRDRGYEVHLLNLDNPLFSMGYNPLSMIIELYKNDERAASFAMARSLAFSIFHANSESNAEPIWKNTATDLFTALIIAIMTDLLTLDQAENEERYKHYLDKTAGYEKLDEKEKELCINRIKKDVEHGYDPILDKGLKGLPPDYVFERCVEHEKQITIYNIILFFSEMVRKNTDGQSFRTALDDYFSIRDKMDFAKLKYATIESASQRTKGSVYTNMLSYLGVFIDENIAKMTAESSINLEDIGFGDRPIAIFLGIPDYDKSTHFIASIFIRQVYFILAKKATNTPSQKCKIPVRFICDEFGNMPEIEAIDELVTVGNGRNIGFDFYVQSYTQLFKLYGDNAQTIIDNCANEVYVRSGDPETIENLSKKLGTTTYIDVQRTGEKLSLKKNYVEIPTEKPLMSPEKLELMLEGECIVTRKLKRKNLKGEDILPTPIFNSVENGTRFLYRYEYLTKTFPNPSEIDLKRINPESREDIDLRERVINVEELAYGIDKIFGVNPQITMLKDISCYREISRILQNALGDNWEDRLGIKQNMYLYDAVSSITETRLISDTVKQSILTFFRKDMKQVLK